jgi:long-chain acyl-CoA synthetase
VREYSTAQQVTVPSTGNLTDDVVTNGTEHPDAVVFSRRTDGQGDWTDVTAREFLADVRAVAKGLIAAGVQAGDRVALISRTRYEWTLVDYAIWTAGAVTVPIYETSSAEQVQWNLGDSGAVAVVLETPEHEALFTSIAADLPAVTTVLQIDAGGLEQLAASGREVSDATLAARREAVGYQSLATIIYTSGTTGRPKGCELTHGNLMSTGRSAGQVLPEVFNAQGSTLLFLPLAHIFARLIQTACVEARSRMGHTPDTKNLLEDLQSFQPTFLLAVPRVFEKVFNGARQKAHAAGRGKVFDAAERTAIAYSEAIDTGGPGLLLKAQHALFTKLVYGKLQAALGGQVRWAVSGGAPLGVRLGHFFRGCGVTILEGYGLTETTAGGAVNTPAALRIGTVGQPSPGVSIRVEDDGEILIKGEVVFHRYWHNDESTGHALADGWFRTGDLGRFDDDGYLSITGRKKELLVTAAGKNVAPAVLEDRVRAHPLVSQVMVVGDRKPFIAALLTLDQEAIGPWLTAHGRPADTPVASLTQDPVLLADLQLAIDDANKAVSHAESIRKFHVLPVDWTEEDGQITPSLKLKRGVVMAQFGDEVEALYTAS